MRADLLAIVAPDLEDRLPTSPAASGGQAATVDRHFGVVRVAQPDVVF